jgi:hypothetical protein
LQDAGNVGAILRCASAFGYRQVLAIKGTAAMWSPKVLRSGMGAHFGLYLIEAISEADVAGLQLPLLTTSSHEGPFLHDLLQAGDLPQKCAWVFGHEGHGSPPGAHCPTGRGRVSQCGHGSGHLPARQRHRRFLSTLAHCVSVMDGQRSGFSSGTRLQ